MHGGGLNQLSAPIIITGSGGFLGFHTRVAARAEAMPVVSLDLRSDISQIPNDGPYRVLHLAGISRGTEKDVSQGNVELAKRLGMAISESRGKLLSISYTNSTQSLLGTPYGEGKREAADLLSRVAAENGGEFNNFLLPNVFGEHGKPDYNMVTSTFSDAIVNGRSPQILVDQELTLVHAQDVADLLLGIASEKDLDQKSSSLTVKELAALIRDLWATYENSTIPDFRDNLSLKLWNTLISHLPPERRLRPLRGESDARGTFREVVRVPGSSVQVSLSDTQPGLTRGNHFHRRKFERFIVLEGSALIRLWQEEKGWVDEYRVTGENPHWIDMPTCWMHSIKNSGSVPLKTLFVSDAPFDSQNPDTFYGEPA